MGEDVADTFRDWRDALIPACYCADALSSLSRSEAGALGAEQLRSDLAALLGRLGYARRVTVIRLGNSSRLLCRFRLPVKPRPSGSGADAVRFTWLVDIDSAGGRTIVARHQDLEPEGPGHHEPGARGKGRWRRWCAGLSECAGLVRWVLECAAAEITPTMPERFPNPAPAPLKAPCARTQTVRARAGSGPSRLRRR